MNHGIITVSDIISSYKILLEKKLGHNLRVYTEISLGLNGRRSNNIFWWGYNNLL